MSEPAAYDPRAWNGQVIDEFRTNNGQVGGRFQDAPLLLMTTQGRRTGRPHTNPVVYLRDADRYLVFASNAGRPTNPDWYRNLLDHAQVTIEIGTGEGVVKPYAALATLVEGDERDRCWERQCEAYPTFRDYQRQTSRTIPVVALQLLDLGKDPELRHGAGQQLVAAHTELRAQLAEIRSRIDALRTTEQPPADLLSQLHQRCLTYCYGLHVHHIREDGAVSTLEEQFPELTPALDHLRAEHHEVEASLDAFATFLEEGVPAGLGDVNAMERALDQVVSGLEAHFTYEETHLLPVLGVVPAAPGSGEG